MGPLAYRMVVALKEQVLESDGARFASSPEMQVAAEFHLGTCSILEYVLSPVQKAFHEAAQER
jgi:membrane fusion protein, hemolysin D